MNTYDEGYLGEETSLYTRSKLEKEDKTKVFSEADKEKYLESLRTEYPKQKSLEEQYAEAKLVPDKDREHYEEVEINRETTFKIGGLKTGIGYIYNKDITTRKEEFGIVYIIEPKMGPNLMSNLFEVKTHEKPNAKIKEFEGFYGSVKGILGAGVIANGEMEINSVEDVNFSLDASVGTPTIGFLAGIGYRKVKVLENLTPLEKEVIRNIIKHRKDAEKIYNIKQTIDEILEYSDKLKVIEGSRR